jgi:hypothetical protein
MKAVRNTVMMMLLSAALFGADQAPFRKASLPSGLSRIAAAVGDRFFVTGKERMQWVAQVSINGSAARTFQVTAEFPAKLRIDSDGVGIVLRPDRLQKSAMSSDMQLLVDTLLTDSTDGLLAAQVLGGSTRHDGRGFRDRTSGQVYDIFTAYVPSQTRDGLRNRARQFWFDDNTGLLRRVVTGPPGSDVIYSEWRQVEGNWFPGKVVRRVNGATVLEVLLSAPAVSARRADAVFE